MSAPATTVSNDDEFAIKVYGRCPKMEGSQTFLFRPSSTVDELYKQVGHHFLGSKFTTGNLSISARYPARELKPEGNQTVHELGVEANGAYNVKFQPAPRQCKKRAAATAAEAKFPAALAAQKREENNFRNAQKRKGGSKRNSKIIGDGKRLSDGKKIKGEHPPVANKEAKASKMGGGGHRLFDGVIISGPLPQVKSKKVECAIQRSGHCDIAMTMINSLGAGGCLSIHLRNYMAGKLVEAQEYTKAENRVNALNGQNYHLEGNQGGCAAADGPKIYTVRYGMRGKSGRGEKKDKIVLLHFDKLKILLLALHLKSSLTPMALAQQPTLFWSLVYNFRETGQNTNAIDAETMLRSTFNKLDWSHLERGGRTREMSVVGKEARKNQAKGKVPAPVAQGNEVYGGGGWELDTPDMNAESELQDCVMKSAPFGEVNSSGTNSNERVAEALASFLFLHVRNWRELANSLSNSLLPLLHKDIKACILQGASVEEGEVNSSVANSEEEDAHALSRSLLSGLQNWRELANSNYDSILVYLDQNCVSEHIVDNWIAYAQSQSLHEIMIEILDEDMNAYEALDVAKSCSPMGLIKWNSPHERSVLLSWISITEDNSHKWSMSDIEKWVSRAHTVCRTLKWIERLTPIQDGEKQGKYAFGGK